MAVRPIAACMSIRGPGRGRMPRPRMRRHTPVASVCSGTQWYALLPSPAVAHIFILVLCFRRLSLIHRFTPRRRDCAVSPQCAPEGFRGRFGAAASCAPRFSPTTARIRGSRQAGLGVPGPSDGHVRRAMGLLSARAEAGRSWIREKIME